MFTYFDFDQVSPGFAKKGSLPIYEMTQRLYIGGLPPEITEKDLQATFGHFGGIPQVEIIQDNKV